MKFGKPQIHNLPINDVTTLGAFAYELQQEAEARGEVLPPAVRLHIGEPSFHTYTSVPVRCLHMTSLICGALSAFIPSPKPML
jgi:hypothetical protein